MLITREVMSNRRSDRENAEAERRPMAVRSSDWFADARPGPEPCFSSGNTGVEKNLGAGLAFRPTLGILRA